MTSVRRVFDYFFRDDSFLDLMTCHYKKPMVLDITDEKNIAQVVQSVSETTGGRLDVLVNTVRLFLLSRKLSKSPQLIPAPYTSSP